MKKFSWHSETRLAPHWYKIYGWLPNRYLPLVMFDSICIYKPNMKGGHRHNSAEFLAEMIFSTFKNSVLPYDGNLKNYTKETKELLKLCKRACDRIEKE